MLQLKNLRDAKGLNMRETAALLGLPYTTYVNYEKGTREPTSEILIQLADFFDTTVDYLVGRPNFPMRSAIIQHAPATVVPSVKAATFSNEEISMVDKFRCLDDRGKAAVLNALNHEYESLPGEKARTSPKNA